MYRATAASYVISPSALAAVSPDPSRSPDQLSARWLLALGSRLVQEVGSPADRRRPGPGSGSPPSASTREVRFASAAERAAFAEELAQAVAALVGRYHDESAPEGRSHRLVVGLHQIPAAQQTESEAGQEN